MHEPAIVGWLLVLLSAATGTYSLVRLRDEPPGRRRQGAAAEALMGWGMAVMAVPGTVLAGQPWSAGVFAALFGASAGWTLLAAGLGATPTRHHLHHAVGALAMAYMALVMARPMPAGDAGHPMPAGHAMPGAASAGVPLLTGALLCYFALYVLGAATRLVPPAASRPQPPTARTADGLTTAGVASAAANAMGHQEDPTAPSARYRWAGPAGRAGGWAWSRLPELEVACRVSMAVGMCTMLLDL